MVEEKLAIRKNIRILALDNLINTYTDVLEDKELNLGPDERDVYKRQAYPILILYILP